MRLPLIYSCFIKTVSKELSGDAHSRFVELFGSSPIDVQRSLDSLFNDNYRMTLEDKIDVLTKMTIVFRDDHQTYRSDNDLFFIAGCIRLPETFEIWSRATKEIRTSLKLYNHLRSNNPRAFLAYMKLLEKLEFNHSYVVKFHMSPKDYRDHLLAVLDKPNQSLYMNPVSSEMDLHLNESKFFDSFADMSSIIVTLLQIIYGRDKIEKVLVEFIKSGIKIYPDDLITVIEKWDEVSEYPVAWTAEYLSLETL